MSLHKFAEQVASQGRGEDSLLVHMTPDEVRNLQKFAEANGKTLTINPTTGLPEAGMLSDLFKTIAPIALGAFLGPGAFGIAGLGLSAGTAGLVTGGLTTLATGSLSRGLMAGLGAYGGAGLAEGLMGAGVGAAQQSAMGSLSADQIAAEMANTELTKQGVLNQAAADATKSAMANTGQAVSSGFNAVTATPSAMGAFAKQNLGNIAAAASPIMAGAMVPTTTKMPENTNPAYIRQKLYDPFTQTYKSLTPIKASEFGGRNFSDAYTNPQTGIAAVLDQRQPTPMAGGGIVALAGGGDAALEAYQQGRYKDASTLLAAAGMSAQDVVSKYGLSQADAATVAKNLGYAGDMSGIQYAAPPPVAQVATATAAPVVQAQANTPMSNTVAAPTYTNYTTEQMGSFLSNPVNKDINIQDAIKATNADPAAVNRYIASLTNPFVGSTDTTGGSGTLGIYNQMTKIGVDPTEFYSAAIANDPKYAGWTKEMIQKGYDLDKGAYALTAQIEKDKIAADPKLGYDKQWVKFMEDNKYSVDDMAQAFGISKNEIQRRINDVKAAETKVITKTALTCPAGYRPNAAGTACELIPITKDLPPLPDPFVNVTPTGFYGNDTGNPLTRTPGDITTNKDGTVTVQPNIPGRPDGGFTGMGQIRDAYEKGGGSLGYTSKAPKTIAEFEQLYNRQTGDSLAAYDYLMGKGGGKYPVQSKAAATGINRPYFSEGMRYKPKFLSYDKDGNTVSSSTNPSTTKTDGTKETVAGNTTVVGGVNFDLTDPTRAPAEDNNGPWSWDVASKKWVQYGKMASGGMAGYAVGGGLGSLGSYSDGGRLLKGPGDGVSDSIPATIGRKQQPARLADGEFVVPARIVSELGNGSTEAGAKKLYAMMDRVQRARGKTTGKNKVAANSRADKYLPA